MCNNLMQGYWKLGRDPRFFLLALASGIPFNGMFLYVLARTGLSGRAPGAWPQHSSIGFLC
jgi:DHA1 family bicyclomycin/chloramphenicol resistance-like MFS transporter